MEFKGKKSGSEIKTRPEINIPKFEDSEYNIEITEQDTFNAVYGIIERRIGKEYTAWFEFETKETERIEQEKATKAEQTLNNNILAVFGDRKFSSEYAS